MSAIAISCTCAGRERAQRIATALVDRRLAACVELSAAERGDRPADAPRDAGEVLLVAKTLARRLDAVTACIRALHDDAAPALAARPIAVGRDYLAWLEEEVG